MLPFVPLEDALRIVVMKQDQTRVYSTYIIWDFDPFGSNSSNRMNIIGETPPTYAHIDPSYFDNILDHPKIIKDEVAILELDRALPFTRSIQQVLSDP